MFPPPPGPADGSPCPQALLRAAQPSRFGRLPIPMALLRTALPQALCGPSPQALPV